jgi:hypothetical protein
MRRAHRTWTEETWLDGTPEQVLDLLTDPEAIARWTPVRFDVLDLDADRLYDGCVARISGALAGRRLDFDVDITEASDRCLALVADGAIEIAARYVLAPTDGGCRVRAEVSVSGRGLKGTVTAQLAEALLAAGALRASIARMGRELEDQPVHIGPRLRPALAAA